MRAVVSANSLRNWARRFHPDRLALHSRLLCCNPHTLALRRRHHVHHHLHSSPHPDSLLLSNSIGQPFALSTVLDIPPSPLPDHEQEQRDWAAALYRSCQLRTNRIEKSCLYTNPFASTQPFRLAGPVSPAQRNHGHRPTLGRAHAAG